MARADLSQLLGNVGETAAARLEPPEGDLDRPTDEPSAPSSETESRAAGKVAKRPTASPKSMPEVEPGAAYLRFVRKETRLRDDQQNALTLHARRLSRARSQGGPRITDNTLIRVAVDLLLARIESAGGNDEAAILKSLNP